eukprot:CAMPEP_0184382834 /NCGR_PEP_ID=MMETSP0007-20130409/6655_1 /TAXON_ID=97485 /ORGANISM="Prymnesium parvum, Strain Texoma1" /LENGTH=144 /DNA_ID=CAMNT_0026729043 /DNA_START=273 /DNA_END=706 /DNA_ORIENTATION=-
MTSQHHAEQDQEIDAAASFVSRASALKFCRSSSTSGGDARIVASRSIQSAFSAAVDAARTKGSLAAVIRDKVHWHQLESMQLRPLGNTVTRVGVFDPDKVGQLHEAPSSSDGVIRVLQIHEKSFKAQKPEVALHPASRFPGLRL